MKHDEIKNLEPKTIFAHGYVPGVGHWVAVRGGIHDWAIYATPDEQPPEYIRLYGNKVWKDKAVGLVDADTEMEGWYRE